MLVRFSVENYLSFRERAELSMVASKKVRKHPEHVITRTSDSGIPLLKLAVLYGANASGKSNLIKAMSTAQILVLRPVDVERPIPVVPFKLDAACKDKPSRFEFEIKVGVRYYCYGFSVTSKRVEEEWLFEINQEPERKIFERKRGRIDFGELHFASSEEEQFLKFTAKGTSPNRLFLAQCREQNVRENVSGAREILETLDWFRLAIMLVTPDTKIGGTWAKFGDTEELMGVLVHFLKCFDTGIAAIDFERVDADKLGFANGLLRVIEDRVNSNPLAGFEVDADERWFFDRDHDGALRASKFVVRHTASSGAMSEASFEMKEESDGTRRLIDLVPAMMTLLKGDAVIAIDELDRSLHPEILHSYLANYMKYSTGVESQLIVTTHDTTLLSRDFLRRDEVWLIEKGFDQATRLVALEEFKDVDKSKDLEKDYLLGRFGGVPVIRDFSWLGESDG